MDRPSSFMVCFWALNLVNQTVWRILRQFELDQNTVMVLAYPVDPLHVLVNFKNDRIFTRVGTLRHVGIAFTESHASSLVDALLTVYHRAVGRGYPQENPIIYSGFHTVLLLKAPSPIQAARVGLVTFTSCTSRRKEPSAVKTPFFIHSSRCATISGRLSCRFSVSCLRKMQVLYLNLELQEM